VIKEPRRTDTYAKGMDSDHQSTSNMVRGCCSEFYSVRAGSRVGSRKLKREDRVED
jgi:hypothetical protein